MVIPAEIVELIERIEAQPPEVRAKLVPLMEEAGAGQVPDPNLDRGS